YEQTVKAGSKLSSSFRRTLSDLDTINVNAHTDRPSASSTRATPGSRPAELNPEEAMTDVAEKKTRELWFLTGSQELYGDETLAQVARNSQQIAGALDRSGRLPAKVVWKPVLTSPEAIEKVCVEAGAEPRCAGVITWMHTFSPAKMWIAGLTRL